MSKYSGEIVSYLWKLGKASLRNVFNGMSLRVPQNGKDTIMRLGRQSSFKAQCFCLLPRVARLQIVTLPNSKLNRSINTTLLPICVECACAHVAEFCSIFKKELVANLVLYAKLY